MGQLLDMYPACAILGYTCTTTLTPCHTHQRTYFGPFLLGLKDKTVTETAKMQRIFFIFYIPTKAKNGN